VNFKLGDDGGVTFRYDSDFSPESYSFERLPPGTYKLLVGDVWSAEPALQSKWFGNSSTPEASTPFVVTSGETTELPEIVLSPNPGRPTGAPPVITRTVLPSGDVKIRWTKPTLTSPILGYQMGSRCNLHGDGWLLLDADTLEIDWWDGSTQPQACEVSVTPITLNGHSTGGSISWSEDTSVQGPILTLSNVTTTGFNVTAQSVRDDGWHYWFRYDFSPSNLIAGSELPVACEIEIELGEPCTVNARGLKPGATYTISAVNVYGELGESTSWSTITVTLPLAVARSQIPARR
jgi:hypothetical protein